MERLMLGRKKSAPASVPAAPAPQIDATDPVAIAAQAERDLAEGRDRLAAAEADRETAQSDYAAAVEAASVVGAQAARARITNAEVAVDIAQAASVRLQAAHEAALDGAASASALARREQRRAEAVAANEAYQETFVGEMPALVVSARKVLRAWAKAELARLDAAAEGVHLPAPDAFRDLPGCPREVIGTRVLDLWMNGNQPFGDDAQAEIRVAHDGSGAFAGRTHTFRSTQKRRYEEIQFRPAVTERRAPNLAAELIIPALLAGEPAGWPGLEGRPSARDVLALLHDLENAPPAEPVEPPIRTERRPIEPAREVATRRETPVERLMRGMA